MSTVAAEHDDLNLPAPGSEAGDDLDMREEAPRGEDYLDQDSLEGEAPPSDAEEMARATRMGWCPREKYRGDPARWIDHTEFLRRGEEKLPILQERLRKQDDTIAGMRREISRVTKSQGEFERETQSRVRGEFEARQRAAVDEADVEAFDLAKREQMEWEDVRPKGESAPPAGGNVDPAFAPWQERNSWYGKGGDASMTAYAESMGQFLSRTRPELIETPQFYDEVENLVKKQFPDHFENPARRRAGAVEGARGAPGGRGKKTYADLPPAAKRKCDEYIESGYVKDKATYVLDYFDDGGDA